VKGKADERIIGTKASEHLAMQTVKLAWRTWPHRVLVAAETTFPAEGIRHVVQKHFGGNEPWTRILPQSLVTALTAARGSGSWVTTDMRGFARHVSDEMQRSCSEPRLCMFLEQSFHYVDDAGRVWMNFDMRHREKVLFVLDSGAVAFIEMTGQQTHDPRPAVFRTAFFPRSRSWVAPRRAREASMANYILRWAETEHHSGGLMLPEPEDGVRERDDETGVEKQRQDFQFITPETWGFERQADGTWVWFAP